MTKLEQILKARCWRGAKVRKATREGRKVYLISHPSGAEAVVYKEPGDMETRAYRKWAWEQECLRRSERWAGLRRGMP